MPHLKAAHYLWAAAVTLGWDKLVIALVAIGGVTLLAETHQVPGVVAVGIYTTVIGYVFGRAGGIADQKADHDREDAAR
jgi:hypothetical protein